MENYVCTVCGYVYSPKNGDVENGIEPGMEFVDVPENWVCPICGVSKEYFEKDNLCDLFFSWIHK